MTARLVPTTRTAAVGELEVGDRRLELVGGDVLDLVGELHRRRSTETAPSGIEREPPVPSPLGDLVGVALDDVDLVVVEAEWPATNWA